MKHEIAGEIYIGSGETKIFQYVTEIITEIQKNYPEIIFNIYSGILEDVTEKIDNGLLDFGIIMEPVDLSKYNTINLPDKDIWGIVMRKDSELAKKEYVTFQDIENLPLILSRKVFRKSTSDNEFFKWFNEKKDKLNIVATHTLFYNAAVMVEKGVGYMITLNNLANTSLNSNLYFRPIKPAIEAHWSLIWKKYQIFTPASKLFLEKIQQKFK